MRQYDFTTKSLEELLEIVENPNDYQSRFVDLATKELELRTPSKGQIRRVTEKLYLEKCKKLVEGSLFQFDLLELPYSKFISERKRRSILLKELKAFKNKRDMMNDGLSRYRGSGG